MGNQHLTLQATVTTSIKKVNVVAKDSKKPERTNLTKL